MNTMKNRSGFTLLEVIIVIIIVGVLASLALPRFFGTIEFSRGQEALSGITAVRGAMERCYLQKGGSYVGCDTGSIDTGDPIGTQPGAHFALQVSGQSATGYTVTALRNTYEGGEGAAGQVILTVTSTQVQKSGKSKFIGIN